MKKTGLFVLVAAMLALALCACSSGGGAGSAGSSGSAGASGSESAEGIAVEQLSASAVKVTLNSASEPAEAEVTINDGEAYTMASNLDSGEAEVVLQLAEGDTTDYAYDGFGVSEMGVDPGTYTVTVNPDDASGVIYILSYDASQLDFGNSESADLFDQIAASIG